MSDHIEDNKLENVVSQKPDKGKKYNLFKIILIVVNAITIIVLLKIELSKGNLRDFSDAMQLLGDNIIWLFIAIGFLLITILMDTMSYYVLIKDTTGESRLLLALKISIIGKYGDGITPMGTGGQPFQIYYLHKYNIELTKAASIPLTRTVVRIIGYNITMLVFFIFFSQEGSDVVKTIAYVGIAINSLLPIIIILFTVFKSWSIKLATLVLKIGHRLKIVKDYEKEKDYWLAKVDDMLTSLRYFNTHPYLFFSMFIFAVIDILCFASIPFFVYKAFGGSGVEWLFVVTSTMYVRSASIMTPTPGTSGMSEATFYAIFANVITGGLIFYSLITWRIITFYVFIFSGIILLFYESFFKKKLDIDLRDESKGRMTNKKRKFLEKAKEKLNKK